ncbi:unnamed protein product [Tilletia controversa]|nr:unnamed protein product [Tilletia controversa]CAD6915882.1 unnamed protein product [Tilletia controversa]
MQRNPRDQLRTKAAPAGFNPASLLPGVADEEQMLEVIISHAVRSWVDSHPRSGIQQSDIAPPPQVFPFLPRRTQTLGLPILSLDEGSVAGNIAVIKAYCKFLGIDTEAISEERMLIIVADAFTILHLRSGQARRLYDRSKTPALDKMQGIQLWSALFHLQYFQNGTVANQSQISARVLCDKVGMKNLCSGNTDFHEADAFIKILFAALVDAILTPALGEQVSMDADGGGDTNADDPEQPFVDIPVDTVVSKARALLKNLLHGDAESVALRHGDEDKADLFFLQGREMLRDAAIYLELKDSVKKGDPGRLLVAAKFTVPRFAATGHHRYVSEVLEMLHQVRHELPPALATTMMSASLVNHSGRSDTWLPADLDIEHQVNELKNVFKVTASSDAVRNGHIGQIINILREQRLRWYHAVGISSRNSKHSERSTHRSIQLLSRHVIEQAVFQWTSGRRCQAYELNRGDDVRRRKKMNERSPKQAKGLATDFHVYGFARLVGGGGQAGMLSDWMSRRGRDMGKETEATSTNDATMAAQPDELEEADNLKDLLDDSYFPEVDVDALMGGFVMLEDEENM